MDKVQVSISKELYERIKSRFSNRYNKFSSIDEYIEHLLLYVMNVSDEQKLESVNKDNREEIKEKLKRLGYI